MDSTRRNTLGLLGKIALGTALIPASPSRLLAQELPLPLHRYDIKGTGRITKNNLSVVERSLGSRLGDSKYNASTDVLGEGFGIGDRKITRRTLRTIEDVFDLHPNGVEVDAPRPTISSAAYFWYDDKNNDNIHHTWNDAQSLPFGGPYDSRDFSVYQQQRNFGHAAGIDVFAVSTRRSENFLKVNKKFLRNNNTDMRKHMGKFYWLYELTGELPLGENKDEDPIDFDRPEIWNKFVEDMIKYAKHFKEDTYHVLDDEFYPVWLWQTHRIKGDFVSAVVEARRKVKEKYGKELAIIGGEPAQFPSNDDETRKRLSAFYAFTSYGHYTPEHAKEFGGTLNKAYVDSTIENIIEWLSIAEQVKGERISIYGRDSPDYWIPMQFGYEDNRGNPELNASQSEIRYYLQQLNSRVIVPYGIKNVVLSSFNEHREAHGIEPTKGEMIDGNYHKDRKGYNKGYMWARELLRMFGPTYTYRQNWRNMPLVQQ